MISNCSFYFLMGSEGDGADFVGVVRRCTTAWLRIVGGSTSRKHVANKQSLHSKCDPRTFLL